MRPVFGHVQTYPQRLVNAGLKVNSRASSPFGVGRRLAIITIWLLFGYYSLAWGQTGLPQEKASTNEIGQGIVQENPIPSDEAPAAILGFRQAHFGMSEEQARQAIRKDFPTTFGKLTSTTHPSEKTIVLSLAVTDLMPHSGDARISYIFGYRSKKLIQVNVVWTSDGNAADDETVVGTANALRSYFLLQKYQLDSVVANHEIAENTILVFRANDAEGRTVLLLLSGVAAAARSKERKAPQPPLTLQLSYIQDAAHPDIFRIAKGQF
jgi:hypothetical protein